MPLKIKQLASELEKILKDKNNPVEQRITKLLEAEYDINLNTCLFKKYSDNIKFIDGFIQHWHSVFSDKNDPNPHYLIQSFIHVLLDNSKFSQYLKSVNAMKMDNKGKGKGKGKLSFSYYKTQLDNKQYETFFAFLE